MLLAVVRLCSKGRRLPRSEVEAQPRAVGDLRFAAPPSRPDPLRRPTKVAELLGEPIGGIEHTIIHSLMDPVVATITATEIVIFGFERDFVDHVLHEYSQGWLVTQALPSERRMRRGEVPM